MAFRIVWYWEPLNSQQSQRLSSTSKYDFRERSVSVTLSFRVHRSLLHVRNLNDGDAGWYFCQAELSNGTLLTPSNRLFLAVQSEYTSALNASTCPEYRAQSTRVPSCASIASDTSSTVGTTPSNLATDGNRGSIDRPSSLPTDHSFLLTTTVTLAPTPTVTTVPDPESDMLQVVLLAAVVVVFCVIIVTLGFIIVILICRKKPGHVKSKTAGKSVFGISP